MQGQSSQQEAGDDVETTLKTAAAKAGDKKWGGMDRREKTIFVVKLTIMLCSFGWIFGNVLTP